jgi:hypothetical protein
VAKVEKEAPTARKRRDGRRQILLYMLPETVKDLKRAALDEEKPAYLLVEEATIDWLKKRKRRK